MIIAMPNIRARGMGRNPRKESEGSKTREIASASKYRAVGHNHNRRLFGVRS